MRGDGYMMHYMLMQNTVHLQSVPSAACPVVEQSDATEYAAVVRRP